VYLDDTLLFARHQDHIGAVVTGIKQLGMDLEEEDDVAGFLGLLVQHHTNGTIELLQTGLIPRIIDALQIPHLHVKRAAAKGGVLGNDRDGVPSNGTFNYASVLGMLGYLQANSRPDITFAVSQCARFASAPRQSHEHAVQRIGQYLKGTMDKGLILHPSMLISLVVGVTRSRMILHA
jgi:hypothetical protein